MQDKALVTIICLCYNQQEFVLESLDSVINQDYKNIELIIVDDCSTDNSKSIIENWLADYPGIPLIANTTNLGITKAFNHALQLANGDYIIDLAADDILVPNCVRLQINAFKNSHYKNLGVVYGNAALITEKGLSVLAELDPKVIDYEKKIVQNLSNPELEQLNFLLEKIRNQ